MNPFSLIGKHLGECRDRLGLRRGWYGRGGSCDFEPVCRNFGLKRGLPIDRVYVETFLQKYSGDIRGHVMEIGDDRYTRQFGSAGLAQSTVLDQATDNPSATLIGDLATGNGIPDSLFDCAILTQTLLVIYDIHRTVANIHRMLRPGGAALITVPGISQISQWDMKRSGDYWRFTTLSLRLLFEEQFPAGGITVESWGNLRIAVAMLRGLAAHEIAREDFFSVNDPDYPVIIGLRAVKPAA